MRKKARLGCSLVEQCLPSMGEALGSMLSTERKKANETDPQYSLMLG
jgi:hypothetical protein